MDLNIFHLAFWQNSAWQGFSGLIAVLTCLASPFLSMLVERLFNKKSETQQQVSAYKALFLREGSLSPGEFLLFLPLQALVAYCLALAGLRVWGVHLEEQAWLELCGLGVFFFTWGLSAIKRKSLAKLLVWWVVVASAAFCMVLLGQHLGTPVYQDISPVKHFVGQYLPAEVKQLPILSLLHTLRAFPTDVHITAPSAGMRLLWIWIYGPVLALFLFGYTFHKQHYARQVSAFAYLSEREKREKYDEMEFQERQASLQIKTVEKEEKEEALAYRRQQTSLLLEKDKLELEKERSAVEGARLELEKKRAEYMLELAKLMVDTLYVEGADLTLRTELLRQVLPALKDFGQKESTVLLLDHLQTTAGNIPRAIPATIVTPEPATSTV
jgi:hypothetical protein